MTYLKNDVIRLMVAAPFLQIAKPKSFLRFLRIEEERGRECRKVLEQFPEVRYEPLDFYYVTLQSIGVLNAALLRDLVSGYGWRGVVWASWLVCLNPTSQYRDILIRVRDMVPHNNWIIDLAVSIVDGVRIEEFLEQVELITKIRSLISSLHKPQIKIRYEPSEAEVIILQDQKTLFLELYRSAGSAAALEYLPVTLWPKYLMDYRTWVAQENNPNIPFDATHKLI